MLENREEEVEFTADNTEYIGLIIGAYNYAKQDFNKPVSNWQSFLKGGPKEDVQKIQKFLLDETLFQGNLIMLMNEDAEKN